MQFIQDIIEFWPTIFGRSRNKGSKTELEVIKQQHDLLKKELAEFAIGCMDAILHLEKSCIQNNSQNASVLQDQQKALNTLNKKIAHIVDIGVDVHYTKPHQIMIWTTVCGGQFRSIEVNIENAQELRNMVFELQDRYGVVKPRFDAHPGDKSILI